MKIQRRLLLTILPVVILTVATVVGVSINISTSSMEEQVINNAQLLSKSYSIQIDSKLKQIERTSQDLSSAIVTAVNIETVLIDARKRYNEYSRVFYTSLEGRIKDMAPYDFSLRNENFSSFAGWKQAKESLSTVVSNPVYYQGEDVFFIFSPVIINYLGSGKPEVIGVSVMLIPADEMFKGFESVVYGDTGSVFILNGDGYFIFSKEKKYIMNKKLSHLPGSERFKEVEAIMIQQKGGFATFDVNGDKSLISFSSISSTKWSLGIIGNYKEFTKGVARALYISLIATLCGILLATVVIFYVVNGVVKPISLLTDLAEKINKGDMSLRSSIKSGNEVGILSTAINGMLDRLTHYNEVLEEEVDERTKELKSANIKLDDKNHELETVNKEMEAINEELNSTVEELDNKNREMEVVNSEMEAINEELKVTVEELDNKNREMEAMNEELKTTNEALDKSNREGEALNEELKTTVDHLNESNRDLEVARAALWSEMELAQKLQTVLLPEDPNIKGFDISAFMTTNAKVGGDYYDVINVEGKDWFLIGDVSGHGVTAGLIMMMVQTSIHVALSQNPGSKPEELLATINKTVHANIYKLGGQKYMTLTVFACLDENRFSFAGAHLPLIFYRNKTESIETIETNGAWLGLVPDIKGMNKNNEFVMESGDILLLYTDGISEAVNENGDQFSQEALASFFETQIEYDSSTICRNIKDLSNKLKLDDDVTVMVLKKV